MWPEATSVLSSSETVARGSPSRKSSSDSVESVARFAAYQINPSMLWSSVSRHVHSRSPALTDQS